MTITLATACENAGSGESPQPVAENTVQGRFGLQTYTEANHWPFSNYRSASDLMHSAGATWVRIPIEWRYIQYPDTNQNIRNLAADVRSKNQKAVFVISTSWKSDPAQTCLNNSISWPTLQECKADYAEKFALAARLISENLPLDNFVMQVGNEPTNRVSPSDTLEWTITARRQDYADLFPLIRSELSKAGVSAQISPAPYNNLMTANNVTSTSEWTAWLQSSGTASQVDVFSLNTYKGTLSNTHPEDNLSDILAMKAIAGAKPLLVTETGFNTEAYPTTQPELNLRTLLVSWIGGANAAILYEVHDRRKWNVGASSYGERTGGEGVYGIYEATFTAGGSEVKATFTPKESANYLKSFLDALGSFELTGHSISADGAHWTAQLRHSDGRTAVVKWAKSSPTAEFPSRPVWTINPAP